MKRLDDQLELSATDLVGYLNCRHLIELETRVVSGALKRPVFRDPFLDLLSERGAIHEDNFVRHLEQSGFAVTRIEGGGITSTHISETTAAMMAGAQVIVQAALKKDTWVGRADILRRIDIPSRLGGWSYEVIDTKLAQQTRGGTVLQLCLYADLVASIQGHWPEDVYVVVPGTGFPVQRFHTSAYAAYYRLVKRAFEQTLDRRSAAATYPDPVEHCDICRWRVECDSRRRNDDHLCLIAGITKIQTAELKRRGVHTASALAEMPIPLQWKPFAVRAIHTNAQESKLACKFVHV